MYNRKNIMKRAWELKKITHKKETFSFCLKMAWQEAKQARGEIKTQEETKQYRKREIIKLMKYSDYKKIDVESRYHDYFNPAFPIFKIKIGEYHSNTKEIEIIIYIDEENYKKYYDVSSKEIREEEYKGIEQFMSIPEEKVFLRIYLEKYLLEECGLKRNTPFFNSCLSPAEEEQEENINSAKKRLENGKITEEQYRKLVDLLATNYLVF